MHLQPDFLFSVNPILNFLFRISDLQDSLHFKLDALSPWLSTNLNHLSAENTHHQHPHHHHHHHQVHNQEWFLFTTSSLPGPGCRIRTLVTAARPSLRQTSSDLWLFEYQMVVLKSVCKISINIDFVNPCTMNEEWWFMKQLKKLRVQFIRIQIIVHGKFTLWVQQWLPGVSSLVEVLAEVAL